MVAVIIILILVFAVAVALSFLFEKKAVKDGENNKQLAVVFWATEEGAARQIEVYTSNGWVKVSETRSKRRIFKRYKWTIIFERDEEFLQSLPPVEDNKDK